MYFWVCCQMKPIKRQLIAEWSPSIFSSLVATPLFLLPDLPLVTGQHKPFSNKFSIKMLTRFWNDIYKNYGNKQSMGKTILVPSYMYCRPLVFLHCRLYTHTLQTTHVLAFLSASMQNIILDGSYIFPSLACLCSFDRCHS